MELAVSKAKRAGWRGDYPIGAVITRNAGRREWSLRTPVTAQKLADQASNTWSWKPSSSSTPRKKQMSDDPAYQQ
jgi:hypothetical protein